MRIILAALIGAFLVTTGATSSLLAQESTTGGAIAGTIWHDTNLDGVKQPDEAGISTLLVLRGPVGGETQTTSDAEGSYTFDDLTPGSYVVDLGQAGFNYFATYPARLISGPIAQSFTIGGSQRISANFGVISNFASVNGTAWVNGDQPSRPQVSGYVGTVQCALQPYPGILVTETGQGAFHLVVLPAGFIPGCGEPDSTLTFVVNGQAATEQIPYPNRPALQGTGAPPFPPPSPGNVVPWLNLTVGPPAMQIYGSVSNPTDPANVWPGDGIVRGLIEGLDCSAQQNSYGGYAISVLPESVKPGCGAEGKYVQFTVGGQATMHALRWQPGQYQFDLQIEPGQGAERSGTARATSVVRPPDTGDGGLR